VSEKKTEKLSSQTKNMYNITQKGFWLNIHATVLIKNFDQILKTFKSFCRGSKTSKRFVESNGTQVRS